jgi:hypothetical protein
METSWKLTWQNFDTAEKFFTTKEFAGNPMGLDFNPEELIRKLKNGEDDKSIKRRYVDKNLLSLADED